MTIKTGVAGVGALGSVVCKALSAGDIPGMMLMAAAEKRNVALPVPLTDFATLADICDVVVECLPPDEVPALAQAVLARNKTLVMISAAALLRFPEIRQWAEESGGRIVIPSGALAGIDAIGALRSMGLKSARIRSTKPPKGFAGSPYITQQQIDLDAITRPQRLFAGNALEAAKAFPANVNVAATLSLAGLGPEKTHVEVWADPAAEGNIHQVTAEGLYTTITAHSENQPAPDNPKTSILAAHSIIACLRQMTEKITVI